jgi:hypothetical protein
MEEEEFEEFKDLPQSKGPETVHIPQFPRYRGRGVILNFHWGIGNEILFFPSAKPNKKNVEETKEERIPRSPSFLSHVFQMKWNCFLQETTKVPFINQYP